MKTRYISAAAIALITLAACNKEAAPVTTPHLRAGIEQPSDTRVSIGLDGKAQWNTDDMIAVHIGNFFVPIQIENPETGDFTIDTEIYNPADRNYFAVYPAGVAATSGAWTATSPLLVNLPTSYDIKDIVAGGDTGDAFSRTADYSPVPMVAANDPDQDLLYFRHVGGLLRVICNNAPEGTTDVKVTFDKDVTGFYTVDMTDPTTPFITNRGAATANTVTFEVSSSGLPAGAEAFALNVPVPCGTYASVSVTFLHETTELSTETYSNASMTFARRHGKVLALGSGVTSFSLGELNDVTTESTGGNKILAKDFVSYKTVGSVQAIAPFVLEYSATGEDETWTTTPPAWLVPDSRNDYSGSTHGEDVFISITPQDNTAEDIHGNYLKSLGAHTGEAIDLSRRNVATDAPLAADKRTTANCYVVQQAGAYKFPAVYGNGLKDGQPNEEAYRAVDENGDPRPDDGNVKETHFSFNYGYLGRFRDHLNENILYPFIADQFTHKDPALSISRAELLWTDVPGLVTDVALEGSGSGTYITFNVPVENICQGNAIIALFDNKDRIAWSWHIWVTDRNLKMNSNCPVNGYVFAPVNLGWCDTKDLFREDERSIYVHARQTDTGGHTSAPRLITSKAGLIQTVGGNSTCYQWGRKDPIQTTYLYTENDKTKPVGKEVHGTYQPSSFRFTDNGTDPETGDPTPDRVDLGTAIQNPHIAYYTSAAMLVGYAWFNGFWLNLWNARVGGQYMNISLDETPVVKTIYDPSPVGYKVPNPAAFKTLNETNFTMATEERNEGRSYGTAPNTVFFPNQGYRDGYFDIRYDMTVYWSALGFHNAHEFSGYGMAFNSSILTAYGRATKNPPNAYPIRPIAE